MTNTGRTFKPQSDTRALLAREEPSLRFDGESLAASPSPELDVSAFALGARGRAILRGVKIAHEDLRASGGAYDQDEVRDLLHGISRQAVDKRVREGSLLAVSGPSNKRHYPVMQFTNEGEIVEGLKPVLEALPTKNGFAVLNFLIHPDDILGGRKPIDLLKAGEVAPVVEAARRMGEPGM